MTSLLVTGGAGFVGSHFVRAAHEAGHDLVILDDLSGGGPEPTTVPFVRGDIGDRALVSRIVRDYRVTAIAHFAGKIAVAESVASPTYYHDHNVLRTRALLEATRDVPKFLFSSSAAVYGIPRSVPIEETAPLAPINPYGETKLEIERFLESESSARGRRWCALRYFNAAGAHPDGTLRENHVPETHLLPLVLDAALGSRGPVTIFGTDYPTPDGTCIRDYIHVCDLATAHLSALAALDEDSLGPLNLGSGRGYSVREVLTVAEEVIGHRVPHILGARRDGDPPALVASSARAERLINFAPLRSDLRTMIEDTLRSRRPSA